MSVAAMFTMRSLRYLLYLLYDIVEPAVQSEVRQKWVWQPCLLRKLFLRVNHSLISRVSHKPLAMNRSCGVHSFLFKAAHQSSEDCENFSRPVFSMWECDWRLFMEGCEHLLNESINTFQLMKIFSEVKKYWCHVNCFDSLLSNWTWREP